MMKIGTDKPLRVVIYVRVSTEGQAEEEAPLAAQIWECREYALTRGWIVVYVIEDGGISGRTDDRPGFQRVSIIKNLATNSQEERLVRMSPFSHTL